MFETNLQDMIISYFCRLIYQRFNHFYSYSYNFAKTQAARAKLLTNKNISVWIYHTF